MDPLLVEAIRLGLRGTAVVAAYCFGSRARGTARPDSDTDVAVLLPRSSPADLQTIAQITLSLERAGVPSPDVHVLAEMPLALQAEAVLRGERVYSNDEAARACYEAFVTMRYLDFEPILRLQYKIQRRRIQEGGRLGRARPR